MFSDFQVKKLRVIGRMTPKKATKQSSITSMGFPLLQKSAEMCVGTQIQVLGSYWTGRMSNEEANSLYKGTVREYHVLHKWDAGGTPSQAMELQEMGVDGQDIRETGRGSSADRIFFMKYPLPFLEQKISNSRLVQVFMSKQPGMDAQKVLDHQHITAETLYKTFIRETNDVVKLPTRQMSPRKTQKLSGGSRMFRGASALECEVTEAVEFDTL